MNSRMNYPRIRSEVVPGLAIALAAALALAGVLVPAAVAQTAAPAQSKQVEVLGQNIHYIEAGSGPAVVLLHGLGGEATNWAFTVPALAGRYRVVAPDQIGFGRSDKPLVNYRVGTMVDFLDGFMKKVGIESATLVGNSLGGWISMAYALAHPERVRKIVLVDSAGFSFDAPKEALLVLNPSTLAGQRTLLQLIFYNAQAFASDAAVETSFAQKLKRADSYTIDRFMESFARKEDFLDGKLSGLRVPVLIIWGREDRLTLLATGERFAKEIRGSETVILEKCGHVPQLEKPAEFNAALLKFLDQPASGASGR